MRMTKIYSTSVGIVDLDKITAVKREYINIFFYNDENKNVFALTNETEKEALEELMAITKFWEGET